MLYKLHSFVYHKKCSSATIILQQLCFYGLNPQVQSHQRLHLEYCKRNVLFCDKTRKFKRGKKEHLGSSENAEINIKDAAKKLDDYVILAKFGDINFVSKEVKYHHSCRKAYINKADRTVDNVPDYEDAHRIAFELLSKYIQMSIADGKIAELLTSLLT